MSDQSSYKHESSKSTLRPTQETGQYMSEIDTTPENYEPDIRNAEAPRLAWDRGQPDQIVKKATPLYVHEVIESEQFLKQLQSDPDLAIKNSLFGDLDENAIYEWYQHEGNWTNRLIHGDSAQIMASLAHKEHMVGKVQMVYFDPPYGISFNSTMQVDASNRSSNTTRGGLSPEPEMVRVFRDTYKRGIHDYLDSIRINITLARSLLKEDGSLFLQIGSENVHRMAVLMDEIFGIENRVATITFCKTGAKDSRTLAQVADYLLWYAKRKDAVKYLPLYTPVKDIRAHLDAMVSYAAIEFPDGSTRSVTSEEKKYPEKLPSDAVLFQRMGLSSQGVSTTGRSSPFEWRGNSYPCPANRHWSVSQEDLKKLAEKNRLDAAETGNLSWKRYSYENPGTLIDNIWDELHRPTDLHYVVETAEKTIERCILMSTEPGDLVLDITCGSGTTPYVAERWGRRWIATDASRIPIALARQRLLSFVHDWWVLSDSKEGVALEAEYAEGPIRQPKFNAVDPSAGFVYERVPYVSASSVASDKPPTFTHLVDRPHKKKNVNRIASPFTIESLSPYRTVSPSQFESLAISEASQNNIEEALRISGCKLASGEVLRDFDNFEPIANQPPLTHRCTLRLARSTQSQPEEPFDAYISIAPDDASCSRAWITQASNEAVADLSIRHLLIIAFNYESDAYRSYSQRGKLNVYCLRANRDLMIDNLEISASDQAFVEIGEPDIEVIEDGNGKVAVEVKGYDTFNPRDGNLKEGSPRDIQCWMVDTNYDAMQFYARRFHFPGKGGDKQIDRFKKAMKKQIDNEEWNAMLSMKSTPFSKPKTGQIAVRIITNTGVEMTTVKEVV